MPAKESSHISLSVRGTGGCRRLVALLFLALAVCNPPVEAKSFPCAPKDYKVLGDSALAIRCADEVRDSDTAVLDGTASLLLVGDTTITQLNATVTISTLTATHYWMLATLSGPGGKLRPKQNYRLLITYSVIEGALRSPSVGPVKLDVDTTETLTIASMNIQSQPRAYKALSHVGFVGRDGRLEYRNGTAPPADECTISLRDDTNKNASVKGKCATLVPLTVLPSGAYDFASMDPDLLGVYDITLNQLPNATLVLAPLTLKSVFGNAFRVDQKSRFAPQKAPATKDASQYYISFNYAAGVGTVPAWVLDGKISPQVGLWRGFLVGPLAAANVGNNKLKGQTYTDTIDFGGTASKIFEPGNILQELALTFGPTYETDKAFDRHNLLATGDVRYNFAKLYHTQAVGTLQKFYKALQDAESLQKRANEEKKNGNSATEQYIPQLDDVKPVLFGHALDFHTGLEAGGALVDTTVTASVGKATQTLPTYPILRVVQQIHGLLEVWRFSFDATMTGRYLVETENTVVETGSHSLFLKRMQGWKGIGTITSVYNWDPQGHFGINITFKDGFAPPTYQRVNAVQAGLLLKY